MKDQRIELRLPQQQLNELDDFIAGIEGQYKPTRSDVLRSFIAQGVRGKFTPASQEAEMFPLAARLNLFFQICQQLTRDGKPLNALSRAHDSQRYIMGRGFRESTVTAETLVRRVYLQRMTWFFELDAPHLRSINTDLDQEMILALMNPQHSPEVCKILDGVTALRDMFSDIKTVLDTAKKDIENDSDSELTRKMLNRIDMCSEDNGLPLTFKGYPDTAAFKLQTEMWAMLDWIERGEGDWRIVDSRLRCDEDLTDRYAVMLEVYQNICSQQRFDLDGLQQLVRSPQFHRL
ncbi:hypothetical protein UM677_001828 [Cronobacter sakazakii]|nr:hypothetical protein [Cronobacter sakazakii]